MMRRITVSLAIIARNERKSSEIIFPKIPLQTVDEAYVIDGNSTDGTQRYYKQHGITVFEQTKKGLGGATFEARKQCKTDAIIFFHPDGNENPLDIGKCASALKNGHYFVIPSRMMKGGYNEEDESLLKPRKWFNKTAAYFVNLLWRQKKPHVSEIVQGFRGIRCDTFDQLHLDRYDCTIDFQMVIRALKYNISIHEFPTIESKRLFGKTSFRSIETGLAELKMLMREIFDKSTYPIT